MYFSLSTVIVSIVFTIPFLFQWMISNSSKTNQQNVPLINKLTFLFTVIQIGLFLLLYKIAEENFEMSRAWVISAFSFFYLYWCRGKYLHQSRGIEISPQERFFIAFRSLIGMALLYGIYLGVTTFFSNRLTQFLGVPLGMIAIYYTTPFILRIMWKTSEIKDPEIISIITKAFAGVKVDVARLYFIEMSKLKFHNALVSGPKWGVGPFQRSLFISRSLFDQLSKEEVNAVLLHEASHFKLHHLTKRMVAALGAALLSLALIVALSYLNLLLFSQVISAGIGIVLFLLIQTQFVSFISRKHEHEADLEAVRMGASPVALVGALKKITLLGGGVSHENTDWFSRAISVWILGNSHPSIKERDTTLRRGFIQKHEGTHPTAQYAITFIILIAMQFSISRLSVHSQEKVSRAVASESNLKSR